MIQPDDGYVAYIVNPRAGANSAQKRSGRFFEKYLKHRGFDVRVRVTGSLADACDFATDAAVDYHCAVVVAVGGDGTVREVAHGLEGSDKPLLIIPGGTENLLANELGQDDRLEKLIETFEAGFVRSLDLGNANGKCFTCVAGFGFDGDVIKTVSDQREGHISHLDYFWPIWRAFCQYRFDPMKVVVDGEEFFEGRGLVFVGNVSRYAIGLKILHKADYGDGLLDVCVYKCASKVHLMKHSLLTIIKQKMIGGDVIYRQGKKIMVTSEVDIATEIDGDPGPSLPVEINVIPHAVRVIVAEGAKPAGMRKQIMRVLR